MYAFQWVLWLLWASEAQTRIVAICKCPMNLDPYSFVINSTTERSCEGSKKKDENIAVFWGVTVSGSCKNRRFEGMYRLIIRVTRIGKLGTTLAVTRN
jgi:hypothetical protein